MKKFFTSSIALLSAVIITGCCAASANQNSACRNCKTANPDTPEGRNVGKSTYNLIVMSDTHYDKRIYNTNTVLPAYWVGEVERNYAMWDNGSDSISYKMLNQVAAVKDDNTAFILHSGDLVHGDFDSPETTAQATKDAIADITGITGLSLYMTVDNHDSCRYMGTDDPGRYPTYGEPQDRDTNNGMPVRPTTAERSVHEQSFLKVAREYEASRLITNRMQEPLFMTKVYNNDLYIFTRGTKAGIEYLAEELAKYPAGSVRYTFVIIHLAPILGKSYGDSKPWQVDCFSYYKDSPRELVQRDEKMRKKVLAELASREAIVLTGHKHYWEKIDAKYSEGTIHQLMTNVNKVSYKWPECKSIDDFEKHTSTEGKKSFLDKGDAKEITDYRLFSDRGFLKLFVSDQGVYGEVYSCDKDGQMTEIIKLR